MPTPTIDLLAEALAVRPKPTGNPCSVVLATRQHPELAASIIAAIYSDASPTAVETVFTARGIDVRKLSIGRHRQNRNCPHCAHAGVLP